MTADELLKDLVHATAYSEPSSDHHRRIIDKVWAEVVKPALPSKAALSPSKAILDIIDVGAGDGYALDLFGREGHRAMGVNYLKADADVCRGKGLDCIEGDMHALRPYWGGQADLVWCRHCLEHSPFPMLALYEFHRVLKPGGLLYVEVPIDGTACRHEENANHWSLFPRAVWNQLFLRSGFDILKQQELTFRVLAGEDRYLVWLCQRAEEKK